MTVSDPTPDTKTGTPAEGMEAVACIALFPMLGPAFGLLSLAVIDTLHSGFQSSLFAADPRLFVFAFAYSMGFIPAFFTGVFAALESSRSLKRRYILGALIGLLTSAVFPGILVLLDSMFSWLRVAAIGAASAVLCLSTVLLLSAAVRMVRRLSLQNAN